jgi:hypothetical protein
MPLRFLRVGVAALVVIPTTLVEKAIYHILRALGIVSGSRHSSSWPFLRDIVTAIARRVVRWGGIFETCALRSCMSPTPVRYVLPKVTSVRLPPGLAFSTASIARPDDDPGVIGVEIVSRVEAADVPKSEHKVRSAHAFRLELLLTELSNCSRLCVRVAVVNVVCGACARACARARVCARVRWCSLAGPFDVLWRWLRCRQPARHPGP